MTARRGNRIFDFFRKVFMIRPLESMLAMMTNGRSNRSFIAKCAPNAYQYPSPSFRKIERKGMRYHLDISDMVDWYFYFGFVEKEHFHLYREIEADDVILDVGSNIGLVAVQMSAKAKQGEVHAFEPFSKNYDRLIEHISMNDIKNIRANKLGVSDKKESVAMASPKAENSGMTRVEPDEVGDLPLTTIDDYCQTQGIKKLDLIKMDVEGYEAKALRGGEEVLKRYRPSLFIELDDANLRKYGDSAKDLVQFLDKLGYRCYDCSHDQMVDSTTDFSALHIDILAKYHSN